MKFEWDKAKARSNITKHGVSFTDGCEAVKDSDALEYASEVDEFGEQRFRLIGASLKGILAVVYSERGDKIRIISARKATNSEKKAYRQQ